MKYLVLGTVFSLRKQSWGPAFSTQALASRRVIHKPQAKHGSAWCFEAGSDADGTLPECTSCAESRAKGAKPEPPACFSPTAPGTCSERGCRTMHFFQHGEILAHF